MSEAGKQRRLSLLFILFLYPLLKDFPLKLRGAHTRKTFEFLAEVSLVTVTQGLCQPGQIGFRICLHQKQNVLESGLTTHLLWRHTHLPPYHILKVAAGISGLFLHLAYPNLAAAVPDCTEDMSY